MEIRMYFEPRDLWIGVYWTLDGTVWRVYVCLLPCVPIRISWWKRGCAP